MTSTDELREQLNASAGIQDILERRLIVLSVITEGLRPKGVTPVLVGGGAVEFYTLGGYATADIDVVVDSTSTAAEVLEQLGFRREGRIWARADIDIVLEMPTGPLAGDKDRIERLDLGQREVFIIGIEDLIIDRLQAAVHWQSAEDKRWAARLIAAQNEEIDWDYLERRAKEEGLAAALVDIKASLAGAEE